MDRATRSARDRAGHRGAAEGARGRRGRVPRLTLALRSRKHGRSTSPTWCCCFTGLAGGACKERAGPAAERLPRSRRLLILLDQLLEVRPSSCSCAADERLGTAQTWSDPRERRSTQCVTAQTCPFDCATRGRMRAEESTTRGGTASPHHRPGHTSRRGPREPGRSLGRAGRRPGGDHVAARRSQLRRARHQGVPTTACHNAVMW